MQSIKCYCKEIENTARHHTSNSLRPPHQTTKNSLLTALIVLNSQPRGCRRLPKTTPTFLSSSEQVSFVWLLVMCIHFELWTSPASSSSSSVWLLPKNASSLRTAHACIGPLSTVQFSSHHIFFGVQPINKRVLFFARRLSRRRRHQPPGSSASQRSLSASIERKRWRRQCSNGGDASYFWRCMRCNFIACANRDFCAVWRGMCKRYRWINVSM